LFRDGFERVLVAHEPASGLHAVIAIHDTTLGPTIGGIGIAPYPDQGAAVDDCCRLARAMTLKAAIVGLDLGGGWSVIVGDPAVDRTEDRLRAHGRFIARLGGNFIPVNDVGTRQEDIAVIGRETSPVCDRGDPSPFTALGVVAAIRACLLATDGHSDLSGIRVAIQGTGNVGSSLARLLAAEGADLIVADADAGRAERVARELGARFVDPDAILSVSCDVLAPCALGGVINDRTLPGLACRFIAGGANEVLARSDLADLLAARGILYVPDFCANAGGLIFLRETLRDRDPVAVRERVMAVGELVADVIDRSSIAGITTTAAALGLAADRLARVR